MSKRKKLLIIGAAGVLILGLAVCLAVRILFFEPKVPSRKDDFLPLVNEYTQVAEFYGSDFDKYGAEQLIYIVPYKSYYSDKDGTEYSEATSCITEGCKHYLSPDEQELSALLKVVDAYYLDKHALDYVKVSGDFVFFCCETGRAEYVYSRNGKKPKSSDCLRDRRALVYKLADNWYFASVPDDYFS